MQVLGIDPGLKGAVASWDGDFLYLMDFPTIKSKARGREIDWTAFSNTYFREVGFEDVEYVYLERVHSRPGEGVSSAFKFGTCFGGLLGFFAAIGGMPIILVQPKAWKKYYGLGSDKGEAVELAERLFPNDVKLFRGPRGGLRDGRAEAALIAKYGYDMPIDQRRE